MAGRSFFRRLLGNHSDATGPDDVSTAPSPAGPIPIPHPFGDGPAPVAETTSRNGLPDDASQSDDSGRQAFADADPTAFDEADAVFGRRTGVADAQKAAPPGESTPQISDDGYVGMNGIISPNNVAADHDDPAQALDGSIVESANEKADEDTDGNDDLVRADDYGPGFGDEPVALEDGGATIVYNETYDPRATVSDEADTVSGQRTEAPDAAEVAPTDNEPSFVHLKQNDEYGQDVADSSEVAIDGSEIVIVAQETYEVTDPTIDSKLGPPPVDEVTDPHPDETAQALASGDGIVGMNGIISPNNVVESSDPDPVLSVEAGSAPGDGYIGMNGIISPNNVADDPDDDLILADLSGGSIDDQLTANAGISFDAPASGLTDDFDDLDDVDVD